VSFHPNDVARRGRVATVLIGATFVYLLASFFNTQIREHAKYALQSEDNRLREVPLPAPRGIIYDRNGAVIAENLPGYSVSILSPTEDSLRSSLKQLASLISLSPEQIETGVRRFKRAPSRPTAILADASFDIVSVLEEHRVDFPGLIIQAAPKRYYPDKDAVASFVGYTGEVTETELNQRDYRGYKSGQQIGKGGLEKQYESVLRGQEGKRFVEVDARGRVVKDVARRDLPPSAAPPLYTNIDMDLQRFAATLFGDSLQGGVIAMDPRTGGVLVMHSAPSFDPNRFVGGIPADYWKELTTDPRRPLYNKVIQGRYPPASTFKLATSIVALEGGLVTFDERMPQPCTGGYTYGGHYYKCWDKRGHGPVTLREAIEKSCDTYFYQLGLKVGLTKLVAGGVSLHFREKSGIDLPNELAPTFPYALEYFDKRYGPRNWSNGVTLSLAIGQGENAQTVANVARFYTALATDGSVARPEIVRRPAERTKIMNLTDAQMKGLRDALSSVVSRGTAAASATRVEGVLIAGKTGTAQNPPNPDHAWFVGFAPAEDPKIVVAVMVEFGGHSTRAVHIASKIIEHYFKRPAIQGMQTEGN
jgi:penicillin-binding protein 2